MKQIKGRIVVLITALLLCIAISVYQCVWLHPVPWEGVIEAEFIKATAFTDPLTDWRGTIYIKAIHDPRFGDQTLRLMPAGGFRGFSGINSGDHIQLKYELWPKNVNVDEVYFYHYDLRNTDSYTIAAMYLTELNGEPLA